MSQFSRIILKISGECLGDYPTFKKIAAEIIVAHRLKSEIGIVPGAGNYLRGKDSFEIERVSADRMGMIGTILNGLLLQEVLQREVLTRHLSALPIPGIVDAYSPETALKEFRSKSVLILSGGTGSPYFTTDTAAALRALELNADAILKGTKVDGIYSEDPKKNRQAKRLKRISYQVALSRELKVMDRTAFALCQEKKIPIIVFNIFKPGNLPKILLGKEEVGSIVC